MTSSSNDDAADALNLGDRFGDARGQGVLHGAAADGQEMAIRAVPSGSTTADSTIPILGDGAADLGVLDGGEGGR